MNYTITNEKFSNSADIATAETIIEMVIENNQDFGTDYTEDDFVVTPGYIKCRGEVIAEAVKVKVVATAPTFYQFQSLMAFGMGYRKNANGSFTASCEFDSVEEASYFLRMRAEMYFETEWELENAIDDIIKWGHLTIDAVTASIISNEE